MFYLSTFFTAFVFGFPLGPSSLEMLRLSSTGRRSQAWMLAIGVATADSIWAFFALIGLLPWLGVNRQGSKGAFFLLAAIITYFLAYRVRHEKRIAHSGRVKKTPAPLKERNRQTSFWKGLMLGISYPLTFGSWLAAFAVFRNAGWRIPIDPPWIAFFIAVVFLGYFSYLAVLQLIFKRFQEKLSPRATGWWQDIPGWLMLGLSVIFLALAIFEIFRFG
ncbi:MAG: LysE family transporter [Candidatus Aminicenantes bacterium]|nr:LysE family transporter [Candidatus Aminicenantes bacterium]